MWLVVLTTFLTPLCVLISWKSVHDRVKEFFILLLLLETALIGVFVSLDLFLFYFFWEATPDPDGADHRHVRPRAPRLRRGEVFPVHHDRLGVHAGGDHLAVRARRAASSTRHPAGAAERRGSELGGRAVVFLGFFLAFAVKVPLFPLHTWLPDAHFEAPTAGSVLLAGVLLKMGTYGLLRFNVGLFPEQARATRPGSSRWRSSASSMARWWRWCSPT